MMKILSKALLSGLFLFILFSQVSASEKLTYENIKGCWESERILEKNLKIQTSLTYCFLRNGDLHYVAYEDFNGSGWDGIKNWKILEGRLFIDRKKCTLVFSGEKKETLAIHECLAVTRTFRKSKENFFKIK